MPDWPVNRARLVEDTGIEVGICMLCRQGKQCDLVIGGVYPRDRILPALGNPWRSIGANDHAMRRGTFSEIDRYERSVARIEFPQHAAA